MGQTEKNAQGWGAKGYTLRKFLARAGEEKGTMAGAKIKRELEEEAESYYRLHF